MNADFSKCLSNIERKLIDSPEFTLILSTVLCREGRWEQLLLMSRGDENTRMLLDGFVSYGIGMLALADKKRKGENNTHPPVVAVVPGGEAVLMKEDLLK